jgi:predicted transcriptional regulator
MAVYLEILGALKEQPRLKTRLAQIANINLARIDEDYLDSLVNAGLVKKEKIESHDVFAITAEGGQAWEDLYRIQKKLNPNQAMPSRFWG